MLERLERRAALSVQRDDLTVYNCLVCIQSRACRRDPPVHAGEVLVLPGPKLDSVPVLDDQGPVAVELQLVDPVVALGEALDHLGGHGRDERGAYPLRSRRRCFHRERMYAASSLFRHLHVSMHVTVLCTGWIPRIERTNQSQTKSPAPVGRHLSGQPRARHSCSSPTARTSWRNPAVLRDGRARSHHRTLSITSVPRSSFWTTRAARSASPRMTLEWNTNSSGGRSSMAARARGRPRGSASASTTSCGACVRMPRRWKYRFQLSTAPGASPCAKRIMPRTTSANLSEPRSS